MTESTDKKSKKSPISPKTEPDQIPTDETALKQALIKQQTCFSKLSENEVEILSTLLTKQQNQAGDVIVTQGDPVDSVFFIVHGKVDVRHVSIEKNKEMFKSIAKLGKGESIGLSKTGFYSVSGVRTATVVAETDVTLYRLSVAAFNGFALAYPHVHAAMRASSI